MFAGIERIAEQAARGNRAEALSWLNSALAEENEPGHRAILYWVKARVLDNGDAMARISDYKRALELPMSPALRAMARYEFASVWKDLGEFGEAKAEYGLCMGDALSTERFDVAGRAAEQLSIIAEAEGDQVSALAFAGTANEHWSRSDDRLETARSRRRTGELHHRIGNNDVAATHLEAAIAVYVELNRPDLAAEVRSDQAMVCEELGKEEDAVALARTAVEDARQHNSRHLPRALYVLGLILSHSDAGDLEAREYFREAVVKADELERHTIAAQAAGDLAVNLVLAGRADDAVAWNEESIVRYVKAGNELGQIVCLRNLSTIHEERGDISAAVEALSRAREIAIRLREASLVAELSKLIFEKTDTPEALNDLVLDSLGVASEGILKNSRSLNEFDRELRLSFDGVVAKLGESLSAEQALQLVYQLVFSAAAKDRIRQSIGLCEAALYQWKDFEGSALTRLRVKYGSMLIRIGSLSTAHQQLQVALTECDKYGDSETKVVCVNELSRVETALGNVTGARSLLENNLSLARSPAERDHMTLNIAHTYMSEWNFGEAEPLLLEVIESATRRGDVKTRAFALSNLAPLEADTGRLDDALLTLEQLGSQERDALLPHQLSSVLRLEGYVLEKAGRLADALDAYHRSASLAGGTRSALISTDIQAAYSTDSHLIYSDAVRLGFAHDPKKGLFYAESGRARAIASAMRGPTSVGQRDVYEDLALRVQARLQPGEAVVDYYVSRDGLYSWLITDSHIHAARTPANLRELFDTAEIYRDGMDSGSDQDDLRRYLTDALISPVQAWLGPARTVYFAPYGPLHFVPFGALGREKRLIEQFDIGTVPALHLLDRRGPWESSWADSATILADPFGDLPGALSEGRSVSALIPGSVLYEGDEATRENLIEGLGQSSTVHVASHAYFDPLNPLASGVFLRGPSGGTDVVRVEDVLSLPPVHTKLLTLSACETRRSSSLPSDDPLGLPIAFFIVGVQTVLASLWRVPDGPTEKLMTDFYTQLHSSAPVHALSVAQRTMHASDPGSASAWSAFVCLTVASSRRFRTGGATG